MLLTTKFIIKNNFILRLVSLLIYSFMLFSVYYVTYKRTKKYNINNLYNKIEINTINGLTIVNLRKREAFENV